MTFDEWFQSKQGDPYASMWEFAEDAFKAGAASRDAEIAELVAALDNSIFVFDLDPKIAKALAKVRKP